MKLAIIDIGTNTVILLIAEIHADHSYHILHDEACITRLGEGIHQNPAFLESGMERTFAALRNFKTTIDHHDCDSVIAVGTAAFRNAKNAAVFITRLQNELQIPVKVISGEKEADLIFQATTVDFKNLPRPLWVVDIGGGSTELIGDDGEKIDAVSLPFGSVKLTERFIRSDPPTENEIQNLQRFLRDELKNNFIGWTRGPTPTTNSINLIATAGTATTLCALAQNLVKYDPAKVHGAQMDKKSLFDLRNRLQNISFKERSVLPCLEPLRADVIVAGAHILSEVVEYFGVEKFWVSDRGLRYGILAHLATHTKL